MGNHPRKMQVAGIRQVGARVEMIEVDEPRPLAMDEVLLEIPIASSYRVGDAAQTLAQATGGHVCGAIVLTP
jgi:hypothetical protein